MMECESIRERLSEYIDDIVDPATKARMEAHLLACEQCKAELSSLRAVVGELSSLESVEAPRDFLERLHERMEPRFTIRRLAEILFLPAHIKIPLELATVAALVLLIFVGLYTHQPEEQIALAPESPPQMRVAQKAPLGSAEPALEKEALKVEPPFEAATAEHEERERGFVQLVLLVKTEASGILSASRTATKAAPVTEKRVRMSEEDVDDTVSRFEGEEDLQVPNGEMKGGETVSRVKDLVSRVDGRVLSTQYDEQTKRPKMLSVEIPSDRYSSFHTELARIASLENPPPTISEKDHDLVRIDIRFVFPE